MISRSLGALVLLLVSSLAVLAAVGYDDDEFFRPDESLPDPQPHAIHAPYRRGFVISRGVSPAGVIVEPTRLTPSTLLKVYPNTVADRLGLKPGDSVVVPRDNPNLYDTILRSDDLIGSDFTIISSAELEAMVQAVGGRIDDSIGQTLDDPRIATAQQLCQVYRLPRERDASVSSAPARSLNSAPQVSDRQAKVTNQSRSVCPVGQVLPWILLQSTLLWH